MRCWLGGLARRRWRRGGGGCSSAPLATAFGPSPEAVAEGRAAGRPGRGDCFSTPLAAAFCPGPLAMSEGRAAGRGICFSAPLVGDVGPVFVAVAVRRATGRRVCFSPLTCSWLGRARCLTRRSLLCAFAADFGRRNWVWPGEFASLLLSPPTLGLARRRWQWR